MDLENSYSLTKAGTLETTAKTKLMDLEPLFSLIILVLLETGKTLPRKDKALTFGSQVVPTMVITRAT